MTERLRLATFNVHHCRGRDGVLDVARTAAVVSSSRAEVVALQEVDRGLGRSGGVDQPSELARLTGLEVSFWPTLARTGGEYGLALAAPERLEAVVESLPRVGAEEPRIAVVARIGGLSVVATHLSTDPTARALQSERVASLAALLAPPVVVVGDLNQTRRRLRPFRRRGFRPVRAGAWWRRPIDHVVLGPGLGHAGAEAIATVASDHPIVVVDLAF
jgi:endonuclease/exonuclease/phosphatase family metal-dependent hydrolase